FESSEIARVFPDYAPREPAPERVPLAGLSDPALEKLSRDRLLSLSLAEMKAIQAHFAERGADPTRSALGADPTDVELEILAQTWSEHCKHKILAAEIEYASADDRDPARNEIPARVDGLFKTTIRGTTSELPKPWLLSVFSDNAGI